MTFHNKLERLFLASLFCYPSRKYLKVAPIGFALPLTLNTKTWLERVSKDKCPSLLGLIISDEGKKFYNIDTRDLNYKTFSE
jgi:hypothetical protein